MTKLRHVLLAGLAPSVLMTGCSGESSANSSQVVAEVNGTELTASQLDSRIRRLPGSLDPRDSNVLKTVLSNFVNETLLAQAAERDKLDKRPAVARDIETSRNVVLANAYIDRNVPVRPVSDTDARRFYNENGAMFANRRIYRLTDLAVLQGVPGAGPVIAEMKRSNATADGVLALARQLRVPVQTNSGEQTGDALPDQLARGLSSMSVSDSVTYQVAQTQHLTRIDGVTDSPVSFEAARDSIQVMLANRSREAALSARLDQLRASSKIEYGELGRKIRAGTAQPAQRTKQGGAPAGSRGNAVANGARGI